MDRKHKREMKNRIKNQKLVNLISTVKRLEGQKLYKTDKIPSLIPKQKTHKYLAPTKLSLSNFNFEIHNDLLLERKKINRALYP